MGFELAVAAVVAVAVYLMAVDEQYLLMVLVFLRLLFCNAVSCETAVSHENAVSCESAISCESRRESQLTYDV
jgi:hypothetical protein